jgi:hypothetical protein
MEHYHDREAKATNFSSILSSALSLTLLSKIAPDANAVCKIINKKHSSETALMTPSNASGSFSIQIRPLPSIFLHTHQHHHASMPIRGDVFWYATRRNERRVKRHSPRSCSLPLQMQLIFVFGVDCCISNTRILFDIIAQV